MSAADERDAEAAGILLLLDAPSIGPRRALDLLKQHGSAVAVIRFLTSSSATPPKVRDFLLATGTREYDDSIVATRKLGGGFKLWCDEDYPVNLAKWDGRPPVLFFKGDLSGLGEKALALVGRVDPTDSGVDSATRFARKCVENGITVVSGLAKGIDGASHASSLSEPPGSTYAVLGHGIDYAYPAENAGLYEQIPAHGAIISQFRTGFGPQRWSFPARNEVMCTLALGTVIVEGKEGCGSIIQADFSFKHRRPVFLLRKNLDLPNADWAHKLVDRGAHVIERFDQVLDVVEAALGSTWRRPEVVTDTLFEVSVSGSQVAPVAALFDLDGVVVDSRDATATALAKIASRHLGRDIDPSSVDPSGAPHKVLEKLGVKGAYGVYKDEFDAVFAAARVEIKVFHEVVAGLRQLKAKGVHLGAITAQPKRRADVMLPPDVRDLFDVFFTYNDTQGKKEVGITKALAKFGVDADHAIFVGDTSKDLEAARKAGVKAVGVLWGFDSETALKKWPHDILLVDQTEICHSLIEDLIRG